MFWADTSPAPVATTDFGEMAPPIEAAGTSVPSDGGSDGAGASAGTSGSIGAGAPVNQPDTSATSCVVRWACKDTAPPPPIATMARLATVCHVRTVLRLDVGGSAVRAGYAVTKPASDDSVAVRFVTTAATPVVGMPARPARGRSARKPPWSRGSGAPARESSTRAGVIGTNRPSADGAALASVNVPTRSITTCVVFCTKTATRPVASTGVTTMLATVSPACSTFRLEASGCGAPAAHTVTKPAAAASVAVTLSTAPDAWAAAGPSSTIRVLPAATGAPVRVSSTRVGPVGTRRPALAPDAGRQAPTTSTTRSVAVRAKTSTAPSSPRGAITRLATVWAGLSTFRFEAS